MAIADRITDLIKPVVHDLGYELFGVEYTSGGNGVLRIYLDDKEQDIKLQDCSRVSRELSALLDVEDPIPGDFNLEVSSPGLDRPLFDSSHYQRFAGEQVKITINRMLNNQRKFKGTLVGLDGTQVVINCDGETVKLDLDNIQKARLIPNWDEALRR